MSSKGMRRLKSSDKYSKSSDAPSNMTEDVKLNNLQYMSSSVQRTSKEHIDVTLDPSDTEGKGIWRSCGSAPNETCFCDELSDMIITMDVSSNSEKNLYTTSKHWPKTQKLTRSQCQKIKKVPEPTRI
jgi:hypothetical protein